MRIEDMIVVSDLDGTVIPGTGVISQENIDAIHAFRERGGIFTCATGRSPAFAQYYANVLDIQGPMICDNGAAIFDRKRNKTVWSKTLPPNFREIVKAIHERNNPTCLEAVTDDNDYYIISASEERKRYLETQMVEYRYATEDELPENCTKILYVLAEGEMEEAVRDIFAQRYPEVEFEKTGGRSFEMMAGGVTKGHSLGILAGIYGKTIDNVIAIGDFYNDIEMLQKAHFGATLENAPDAVKKAAKRVFPSCAENGVAALLEYLIQNHDEI